ncbi:MAG: hypothetical protein J5879_06295 [Clostridia bacterium]|nr:hypothetical protein [Clostridia bacterium]
MKEEIMRRAIGGIDDNLIEGAEKEEKKMSKNTAWIRWVAIAAALITLTVVAAFTLPLMFKSTEPVTTPDTPSESSEKGEGVGDPNYTGNETILFEKYVYTVDSGRFATYVQGKAINKKYVGEKIDNVTVTAGWVRPEGLPQAEKEHARAEIYEIKGVSEDTAVAIKFLDKLEAQTTDFYYVIMDPNADLTPVQPYVITYTTDAQNDGGEIPE